MTAEVSTTRASVHVIDDDDSFRRSMTRMLTAAGFVEIDVRTNEFGWAVVARMAG